MRGNGNKRIKKNVSSKDVQRNDSLRCDGVWRRATYSDISVSNIVNEKETGR